jgi:hypothetical protein
VARAARAAFEKLFSCVQNTIPQRRFPNRASIGNRHVHLMRISKSKTEQIKNRGQVVTKQEERLAQERQEIATRIANFRKTQEKFEREREEYFQTTMQNARRTERPSLWS